MESKFNISLPPIRKISIGSPKEGLHYVIGNSAWRNSPFVVHDISVNEVFLNFGYLMFDVFCADGEEVFLWKTFPTSISLLDVESGKVPDVKLEVENVGVTAIEFELMRDNYEITRE